MTISIRLDNSTLWIVALLPQCFEHLWTPSAPEILFAAKLHAIGQQPRGADGQGPLIESFFAECQPNRLHAMSRPLAACSTREEPIVHDDCARLALL